MKGSYYGKKRIAYTPDKRPPYESEAATSTQYQGRSFYSATDLVMFEYIGRAALTTVGPMTNQRYHFARPGAQVPVDRRDAPSLAAVPNLRRCG